MASVNSVSLNPLSVYSAYTQRPHPPPNCRKEGDYLLPVVMTPGTLDECVLAIEEDEDIVLLFESSFVIFFILQHSNILIIYV